MNTTEFWPCVVQVIPTDDYKVYAYFNDGTIRLFDAKPLIKKDTVFEPLEDLELFKEKLSVINDTVAWDMGGNRDARKCIDLDPFVIYEQPIVADPLSGEIAETAANQLT